MKIQSLALQNFRNYSEKKIIFSEGVNVFMGENGVGKTNILEAIFSLSFSKPFRSTKKEVFVHHHRDYGRIKGIFFEAKNPENSHEQLEIFWGIHPKKTNLYKRNDIKISASSYIKEKKFLSVLFSPEEMNLPIAAPAQRRKFLARVLSPLFPEYFEASLKYNSVLKNRNALLKKYFEGTVQRSEFFFWDEELAKYHTILQHYRKKFLDFVNEKISGYYQKIAKTPEHAELKFFPSVEEADEKNFLEILSENFEIDVRRGRTTQGSHRDDFQFFLRDIPLEEAASRGETRTTLLALKKCEQDFVEYYGKSSPILLLDDVFSELDIMHQEHLLQTIQNSQTIITCTELHCSFEGIENLKVHAVG